MTAVNWLFGHSNLHTAQAQICFKVVQESCEANRRCMQDFTTEEIHRGSRNEPAGLGMKIPQKVTQNVKIMYNFQRFPAENLGLMTE